METTYSGRIQDVFGYNPFMDMKRQPNIRIYWQNFPSIFHCLMIFKLMRLQFKKLKKCFHICNQAHYVMDKDTMEYDKLDQVKEMVFFTIVL